MRVLVTGGAGFIGSHLTEALLTQEAEVICLDSFNDYYAPSIKRSNIHLLSEHDNWSLIEGDILDTALLAKLFEETRFDVVVHLAARAGVRPSIQQPILYEEVNIRGTMNLLEMAREFEVGKFIFGSSSSVYGKNKKVPFSEEDFVDNPISPYAATKKAGELICYTYHHLYSMPVSCLRFFTVYGPRQRPDMAIHKFTKSIYHEQPITMFGDGNSRRDYTYISDIVAGIIQAIEHCSGYHVYNLGESKTIELRALIELIGNCIGKEPIIRQFPDQPGDVPITYADISKARREINYQPKVTIEQGIERFVKWYTELASA